MGASGPSKLRCAQPSDKGKTFQNDSVKEHCLILQLRCTFGNAISHITMLSDAQVYTGPKGWHRTTFTQKSGNYDYVMIATSLIAFDATNLKKYIESGSSKTPWIGAEGKANMVVPKIYYWASATCVFENDVEIGVHLHHRDTRKMHLLSHAACDGQPQFYPRRDVCDATLLPKLDRSSKITIQPTEPLYNACKFCVAVLGAVGIVVVLSGFLVKLPPLQYDIVKARLQSMLKEVKTYDASFELEPEDKKKDEKEKKEDEKKKAEEEEKKKDEKEDKEKKEKKKDEKEDKEKKEDVDNKKKKEEKKEDVDNKEEEGCKYEHEDAMTDRANMTTQHDTSRVETQDESHANATVVKEEAKAVEELAKVVEKEADSIQEMHTEKQTLTLMTYNIYGLTCEPNKIADYIKWTDIDILCTQEDVRNIDNLKGYKAMNDKCGKDFERVQMYVKDKLATREVAQCIDQAGQNGMRSRNAMVTVLDNGLKIASLHLEGGRFADPLVFTNFKTVLAQKLGLLRKVIATKPDIICGDFNSVYSENARRLQQFMQSQYNYFKTLKNELKIGKLTEDDQKNIRELNAAPYNLLKEQGYTYAVPSNDLKQVTNGNGKTTIDCFWYKKDRVSYESCVIIDKGGGVDWGVNWDAKTCHFSDHNPVRFDCSMTQST